eukprot:m.299617 g.299617  ORF g.299617 m.299617 type:complete len:203 (+) comp111544_c0_seq1:62-670(+)
MPTPLQINNTERRTADVITEDGKPAYKCTVTYKPLHAVRGEVRKRSSTSSTRTSSTDCTDRTTSDQQLLFDNYPITATATTSDDGVSPQAAVGQSGVEKEQQGNSNKLFDGGMLLTLWGGLTTTIVLAARYAAKSKGLVFFACVVLIVAICCILMWQLLAFHRGNMCRNPPEDCESGRSMRSAASSKREGTPPATEQAAITA